MSLVIKNQRQVLRFTALITLISTAAPVLVVGGVMAAVPGMPSIAILFGVTLAFLIPLLIAPPIAYLGMTMMRMLHETISKVDDHVKFDALTGVLNRSHFLDCVRGRGASGVLMILDADHFKRVNDERGHAAGDHALRVLAHAIDSVVGPNGFVGRLGGEEFGVFLPGIRLSAGMVRAEQICATIRALEMIVENRPLAMTVSIGCVAHAPETTIGHSLKLADELLYAAKANGRDCVMSNMREDVSPRELARA